MLILLSLIQTFLQSNSCWRGKQQEADVVFILIQQVRPSANKRYLCICSFSFTGVGGSCNRYNMRMCIRRTLICVYSCRRVKTCLLFTNLCFFRQQMWTADRQTACCSFGILTTFLLNKIICVCLFKKKHQMSNWLYRSREWSALKVLCTPFQSQVAAVR